MPRQCPEGRAQGKLLAPRLGMARRGHGGQRGSWGATLARIPGGMVSLVCQKRTKKYCFSCCSSSQGKHQRNSGRFWVLGPCVGGLLGHKILAFPGQDMQQGYGQNLGGGSLFLFHIWHLSQDFGASRILHRAGPKSDSGPKSNYRSIKVSN